MLELPIPERELWDESSEQFVYTTPVRLKLEHSLISVSRWESKWKEPFLKSLDQMPRNWLVDYVRCMSLVDKADVTGIGDGELQMVLSYINDPHTATKITDRARRSRRRPETVTSELVYYWMTQFNIPFSCEKWHFNRLMTLIRVCQAKGGPPEKLGRQEAMQQRALLNAKRRAAAHSRG